LDPNYKKVKEAPWLKQNQNVILSEAKELPTGMTLNARSDSYLVPAMKGFGSELPQRKSLPEPNA
jgi:hypothetical protein